MEAWILQIEHQRHNASWLANSGKHLSNASIYKVPQDALEEQEEFVFRPYMISIGPYHHGTPSCQRGEDHKKECLLRFLNRNNQTFRSYVDALDPIVDELRNEYDELDPDWLRDDNKNVFLQMMVVDGCFLLEIMLAKSQRDDEEEAFVPGERDDMMDTYIHDMLLFDNQIPLKVLGVLHSVHTGVHKGDTREVARVMEHILRFFSLKEFDEDTMYVIHSFESDHGTDRIRHILHYYLMNLYVFSWEKFETSRLIYLSKLLFKTIIRHLRFPRLGILHRRDRGPKPESPLFKNFNIPSATQIHKARIGITTSRSSSLRISFKRRTLIIPRMVLDNTSKSKFHNLILLEIKGLHGPGPFCTYAYFMNGLLKGALDVSLLQDRGIIHNTMLGDNDEVVELFRGLCKNKIFNTGKKMDERLFDLGKMLRERHNKNMEEWRKDLYQNYLRSPWTIAGLIFAFILFSLTVIQTIYTVLGYYKS